MSQTAVQVGKHFLELRIWWKRRMFNMCSFEMILKKVHDDEHLSN